MTEDTISYVQDAEFVKMTSTQRLRLPAANSYSNQEISRLVLIPSRTRRYGYHIGHFFAYTPHKGWWRPMSYDCWRVVTDYDEQSTATPRYMILQGDFEYGGVQIFSFIDEHHKAYISYGGEIKIKKIGIKN